MKEMKFSEIGVDEDIVVISSESEFEDSVCVTVDGLSCVKLDAEGSIRVPHSVYSDYVVASVGNGVLADASEVSSAEKTVAYAAYMNSDCIEVNTVLSTGDLSAFKAEYPDKPGRILVDADLASVISRIEALEAKS